MALQHEMRCGPEDREIGARAGGGIQREAVRHDAPDGQQRGEEHQHDAAVRNDPVRRQPLSPAYGAIARSTIGCVHDAPYVVEAAWSVAAVSCCRAAGSNRSEWRCPVNSLLKKKSRDANRALEAVIPINR